MWLNLHSERLNALLNGWIPNFPLELYLFSLRLEFRLAHESQINYIRIYDNFMKAYGEQSPELFHPNGSFRYSEMPSPPPVPEAMLNVTRDRMEFLEGLSNIIHLSTICLLPYILELLCYSAILYILSVASKGDFISLRDVFHK